MRYLHKLESKIDTLYIGDLKISTHIGVHAWEQQILQPLLLDLIIPIDIQHCQDNLEHTLDYATLCQHVTEFVASRSFQLIETVAVEVSAFIKATFPVKNVTVKVNKPNAVANARLVQIISNSNPS